MAAAGRHRLRICHAIYFINLASLDDEIYRQVGRRAARTPSASPRQIGADVCFHVGSHRGKGLEATMPRIRPGSSAAFEVLAPDCWLLLENSAGAGDTIGRDVGELAAVIDAVGPPAPRALHRHLPHLRVGRRPARRRRRSTRFLEDVDGQVGLDRLRALHVNDAAAAARLEPRPARQHARGRAGRGAWASSSPTPRCRAYRRSSRRRARRARARTARRSTASSASTSAGLAREPLDARGMMRNGSPSTGSANSGFTQPIRRQPVVVGALDRRPADRERPAIGAQQAEPAAVRPRGPARTPRGRSRPRTRARRSRRCDARARRRRRRGSGSRRRRTRSGRSSSRSTPGRAGTNRLFPA